MSDVSLPQTIEPPTVTTTEVQANFEAIRDYINGDDWVSAEKIEDAAKLGISETGIVRRGKSIIATEETRDSSVSGTGYNLLTTPDQVASVAVPADGLLVVGYMATWKESVDAAARAAIFIGSNQLKITPAGGAASTVQEAFCQGAAGVFSPLTTYSEGLYKDSNGTAATAYTGDVTTGQVLGSLVASGGSGFCVIDNIAAGTYTISIQFKASSGTLTVKNRRLKVFTIGF